MTSARKLRSNRENARSSTGPKTANGRRRSARNALRYGLSLPVLSDPILSQEVAALAREQTPARKCKNARGRLPNPTSICAASALCAITSYLARLVTQITTPGGTGTKN